MKQVWALVISLAAAMPAPAVSAVFPHPSAGDPRIQTVDYDPQQVVVLQIPLGYALVLEFAADERIQNVAVGNGAVWQVTPNKDADHLFVKPTQGGTPTDMMVITDARNYAFELRSSPSPDASTAYIVRFIYPEASSNTLTPESAPTVYRFEGSRRLRPMAMRDDGQFTYITWPGRSPIPAISFVDSQGHETLANGAVRDGQYIIDHISDRFIFRVGGEEASAFREVVKARRR